MMETEHNQDVSQADDSVEDRLANIFEKSSSSEEVLNTKDENESGNEGIDADASEEVESSKEEGVEEEQEVEIEGEAYRLSPKLAKAVMLHKDYTQKTQQLAEHKKSLEAAKEHFSQVEQFRSKAFAKAVELQAINASLKDYSNVDWVSLRIENPEAYAHHQAQASQLREQQGKLGAEIEQIGVQEQQATAQQRQQMRQIGLEVLQRDIKGWGVDLQKAVFNAAKGYGFQDSELSNVFDPRLIKAFHDAHQWQKLQSGKSSVEKKIVKSKPIKITSSRNVNTNEISSRYKDAINLSKKTGKTSDIENRLFLAMQAKRKV